MSRTLERIRKGGTAMLDFSEHVDRAIERGWIVASLVFGAGRIRTGHLVLGMLDETELTRLLLAISDAVPQARRRTAGPRPRTRSSRARPKAQTARSRWRRPAPALPASCRRRRWARPRRSSASPRT